MLSDTDCFRYHLEMPRLSSRLSFRQARNAVIIALLLGLTFSLVQIASDLFRERESVERTVHPLLVHAELMTRGDERAREAAVELAAQ